MSCPSTPKRRQPVLINVLAVVIALLLAACGGSGSGDLVSDDDTEAGGAQETQTASGDPGDGVPEEFRELYDAALEDGTFTFSTSTFGMDEFLARFQETFPGVTAEWLPRSGGESVEVLVTELSAGQEPGFDVSFTQPGLGGPLLSLDPVAIEPVDWAELGVHPNLVLEQYDGHTVRWYDLAYIMTYNTGVVGEDDFLPTTWEEVLDFEAGPIANDPRGHMHGEHAYMLDLDYDAAYELAEQLAQKDIVLPATSGLRMTTVASGQAALGWGDHLHRTLALQAQGAPLEWIRTDVVPTVPFMLYVPRGAQNLDAAKLFVTWATSPLGIAALEDVAGLAPDADLSDIGFESEFMQLLDSERIETVSQLDYSLEEMFENAEFRRRVAELFQ